MDRKPADPPPRGPQRQGGYTIDRTVHKLRDRHGVHPLPVPAPAPVADPDDAKHREKT